MNPFQQYEARKARAVEQQMPKRKPGTTHLTPEYRDYLLKLVQSGKSREEVCRIAGVSRRTVDLCRKQLKEQHGQAHAIPT